MLYSVKKTEISKETMQYEFNYKIKRELSIECSIVAVDEMIKEFKNSDSLYATKFLADYWQSVKTELEILKN